MNLRTLAYVDVLTDEYRTTRQKTQQYWRRLPALTLVRYFFTCSASALRIIVDAVFQIDDSLQSHPDAQ